MDILEKKITWACRRGMKELDLIFIPFVQQQFPLLSKSQQLALEQLLQLDDLTLFDCFFNHKILHDDKLQQMVNYIIQQRQTYVAN